MLHTDINVTLSVRTGCSTPHLSTLTYGWIKKWNQHVQKHPINLTSSSDRRGEGIQMSAFRMSLQENYSTSVSIGLQYSKRFCFASPVGFGLMFELVCLNDRAAPERCPQAPLSPGFKGPPTQLLSTVREMRVCGGEITCAGPSPEPCASLTGLLARTRQEKSLYLQKDHGRRNHPLSLGHQGLKPGLRW